MLSSLYYYLAEHILLFSRTYVPGTSSELRRKGLVSIILKSTEGHTMQREKELFMQSNYRTATNAKLLGLCSPSGSYL